jgi:predicted nucleic acid-binding protein
VFVLDCSVTMAWVFPDEATDATARLRDLLQDDRAVVPSQWAIEVGSVLLAATRRKRIGVESWQELCAYLEALPIEIDPFSVSRVWGAALRLAHSHDLSVDDAVYLELALRRQLPLATLDHALGTAARAAGLDTPADR